MTDRTFEIDIVATESPQADELATVNHLRARIARALETLESQDTLAGALARLRTAEGTTTLQIAASLGTDIAGLDQLALCRPPRDQAFVEDTNRIADYCGCAPTVLLTMLRRVQVLTTFADAASAEMKSVSRTANTPIPVQRTQLGVLIAAREANVENKAEGDISDPNETPAGANRSAERDPSNAKSE